MMGIISAIIKHNLPVILYVIELIILILIPFYLLNKIKIKKFVRNFIKKLSEMKKPKGKPIPFKWLG